MATACAGLLGLYLVLSLFNDHRGYLGTDTGAKVATLRVMEDRGRLDPDVGYWAERWDPEGRVHPLYQVQRVGERWVIVTTLPALLLASPLFDAAGYRAALLVPMAGALLGALAARALARRLGAGGGWAAFWTAGVASPLAVYALDFWEHSLGVGLLGWAAVLLVDLVERGGPWRAAGAAALAGAAATTRTEALVYGAVAVAAACVVLLVRAGLRRALVAGAAAAVAVLVPLALNAALERSVLGTDLRSGRALGTAQAAGGEAAGQASRLEEGAITSLAFTPERAAGNYVLGALLLALLAFVARRAVPSAPDRGPAALAAAGVAAVYLISLSGGLGFVPGMVPATPLAAVGLAWGWRRRAGRLLVAIALAALPIVWAFQFTGGAQPQWAGRYVLASGFLLAVVGAAALPGLVPWARRLILGLALAVTAFGLAWLSERSHNVGEAAERLAERPEPVLVSRVAFLLREAGWYYPGSRWLTAVTAADERFAASVVARAGFDRFGLVELDEAARPHAIPGFRRTGDERVRFFDGVPLRVTTYARVG